MDQQCTVTRPGLSPMASALAVELAVSVVQQRHGPASEADASSARFSGPVPHMLRGGLDGWSLRAMEGHAYGQCTACSGAVCAAYRDGGWDGFLREALQDPASIEELTGLKALHDQMLAAFEEEDDELRAGEGRGEEDEVAAEALGSDDDWLEL